MYLFWEGLYSLKKNYFKNNHANIKYKKWLISITLILGSTLIIFNDLGLMRWYELRKKRIKIQNEIDFHISKELDLTDELNRLTNDSEYIKKIAKERFQMVKPGEKIFRVRDKRNIE